MRRDSWLTTSLAAGYAYCAISALYLLDRPLDAADFPPPGAILRSAIPDMPGLLKFLACRQFEYLESEDEDDADNNFVEPPSLEDLRLDDDTLVGFNGRWNKPADTCYCWWVGGSLAVRLLLSPPRSLCLTLSGVLFC